jgi:hypothetical protein
VCSYGHRRNAVPVRTSIGMKLALALAVVLTSVSTHAQIFKCADPKGGIIYQQGSCAKGKTLATLEPDLMPPDPMAEERLREYRRQLDANYENARRREDADRHASEEAELRRRALDLFERETVVAEQAAYGQPAAVFFEPPVRKPRDARKSALAQVNQTGLQLRPRNKRD